MHPGGGWLRSRNAPTRKACTIEAPPKRQWPEWFACVVSRPAWVGVEHEVPSVVKQVSGQSWTGEESGRGAWPGTVDSSAPCWSSIRKPVLRLKKRSRPLGKLAFRCEKNGLSLRFVVHIGSPLAYALAMTR